MPVSNKCTSNKWTSRGIVLVPRHHKRLVFSWILKGHRKEAVHQLPWQNWRLCYASLWIWFYFCPYTHIHVDHLDQTEKVNTSSEEQTVELSDILMFFTGTTHIPPSGFPNPDYVLSKQWQWLVCHIINCNMTLRMPVHYNQCEDFCTMMTFSILGSEHALS